MICSIVALGSSAQDWHKVKCDLSIGVNDALRWGHDVDQLVIVNFPRKFTPERMKYILSTKAKIWIHTSVWKTYFPNAVLLRLSPFTGFIRKDHIYSTKTSPMVAMSLAIKQGAKDIILWGIDFQNHRSYTDKTKDGIHEIKNYLKFFEQVKKLGINIWRGADNTAFDLYVPLWGPRTGDDHELVFDKLVM